MDSRAWWATVHRVAKSQTRLKQLSTHILTHTSIWWHSIVPNLHWLTHGLLNTSNQYVLLYQKASFSMYSSFYYVSSICQWRIQPLCSPGSNTITSYLGLLSLLFCSRWTRGSRHWSSRAQDKAITIPKAVFLWSFTGGAALTSSFSYWKSTMTLYTVHRTNINF